MTCRVADLRPVRILAILATALATGAAAMPRPGDDSTKADAPKPEPHRSPIALALAADGSRVLTANQTAGTVSLVDPKDGTVLHEVATGDRPAGVALSRDGHRGAVTHWYGYDLAILDVQPDRLAVVGRVEVGPEPRGVVLSEDGKTAYVAVGASNEVVRVDLDARKVTGRLAVGREPRGLAITPDGKRLVVGNARGRTLSVIATDTWEVERTLPINGDNIRQVTTTADGKTAYVANMLNRGFATTRNNVDIGWVLGQRLTRIALDGSGPYEALALDPQGMAAGDAQGVAVSRDGKYLAVACGGTHEVLIFRTDLEELPFRENGSRDVMPFELLRDDGRFRRVALGGRPTELAFDADGRTLYVANYLGDSLQVVDADAATLSKTVELGAPKELSLERKGEILFHDAKRSSNQWYSCNTCHSDGHTNGLDFDTMNDGWQDYSTAHKRSRKKVPTLRRVAHTAPWTWHGWQTDLEHAVFESYTKSMQGPRPTADEAKAVAAFLATLDFPRNPNRLPDGSLTEAARRGEAVFRSPKAACNTCHGGPEFTDGKVHIVGLEEPQDVYRGYNPPSLRGLYDKDPYLHDGRSKTLRDALTGPHEPDKVTGLGSLTDDEMSDLIEYLKQL